MTNELKEEKKELKTNLVKELRLALKEVQEQLIKLGKGFGRNIKLEHLIKDE